MKGVWSYIIIGILATFLVGGGIYSVVKVSSLKKEKELEKRKAQYWNDSLRVIQNELGITYEKYAIEKKLNEGIISELSQKVQALVLLVSSTSVYESKDKDTLFAFHSPTYKDSGALIILQDSIWFVKKDSIWRSSQKTQITAEIDLLQIVGRDHTGNFFGRVTTKSNIIKISNLKTIVDDKYLPQINETTSSPSIFSTLYKVGIAADLDYNTFALGGIINVDRWQVGLKYVIFPKEKIAWYENLRTSVVYYIF